MAKTRLGPTLTWLWRPLGLGNSRCGSEVLDQQRQQVEETHWNGLQKNHKERDCDVSFNVSIQSTYSLQFPLVAQTFSVATLLLLVT